MPKTPDLEAREEQTGPDAQGAIAPWPQVDRYPIVQGQNLTLTYVASCFRLAQTGYRLQLVDLLDELLEREPHGFAVLSQRVLAVAGARLEVIPADAPKGSKDEDLAKEIAEACAAQVKAIPCLAQALAWLQWGVYYQLTCAENIWERDGSGWRIAGLAFVHSRRLAYPDPNRWDLHIWDQGSVIGADYGTMPTNRTAFGLRVRDYPGKFIVHSVNVRGDYPTRDGLGRQLADYFALKRMAVRNSAQYLERFAKPWALAEYTTTRDQYPRTAEDEDVDAARAAMNALGAGNLSSWVHPNSIRVDLKTPDGGGKGRITFREFVDLIDAQISKAVLGQTLTTEMGSSGSRAAAEVHKRGALEFARYDAAALAETLRRDLVSWIVRLNWPNAMHLVPRVILHVDEEPDPLAIVELAQKAALAGVPVDADALADRVGLKTVDPTDKNARRMAPVAPVPLSALDPSASRIGPEGDREPQTTNDDDPADEKPTVN